MDLWKIFEINERITDIWQELGISAGTAIVVLIILYFIIKWAVKNGITEAYKKITEKKTQDNLESNHLETNKIISSLGLNHNNKSEKA